MENEKINKEASRASQTRAKDVRKKFGLHHHL
jgi:hypothetical protein